MSEDLKKLEEYQGEGYPYATKRNILRNILMALLIAVIIIIIVVFSSGYTKLTFNIPNDNNMTDIISFDGDDFYYKGFMFLDNKTYNITLNVEGLNMEDAINIYKKYNEQQS